MREALATPEVSSDRFVGARGMLALRRENRVLRDAVAALKLQADAERATAAEGRERLALMREVNQHLVLEKLEAVDARTAADAGVRRQTVFLSILAHELRNPMASIAMANSIMDSTSALAPRMRKLVAIVRRQVAHLMRLVDDLLDVSRITTGKLSLQRNAIALADIVEGALDTAQPFLTQRTQDIVVSVPQAPVRLEGDLVRLAQLLSNLVINASKFSAPGQTIFLSARTVGHALSISVKDQGKGVAPEHQPHIFELFSQGGEDPQNAPAGGLGIGLSLVRTIAEMHGGSVRMSSAGIACGSEFTVLLPLPVVTQRT